MSLAAATLKYYAITKVAYFHSTAYFYDMASIALMAGIRLWVLSQLYAVTYNQYNAVSIGGLTVAATVWSLAITNTLMLTVGTRGILLKIQDDVKTGNIAHSLAKPYSFVGYMFFYNTGRFIARVIPTLFLTIAMAFLLTSPIPLSYQGLLAGLLLAVLGLSINTFVIISFGLLAFWAEEVRPFRWVYEKAQLALGGLVVPLSLLPDSLRTIAEALPFAQTYYAPARVFVAFDQSLFLKFLALQLFWLVVCGTIMVWLFKKGAKEVSINGG